MCCHSDFTSRGNFFCNLWHSLVNRSVISAFFQLLENVFETFVEYFDDLCVLKFTFVTGVVDAFWLRCFSDKIKYGLFQNIQKVSKKYPKYPSKLCLGGVVCALLRASVPIRAFVTV